MLRLVMAESVVERADAERVRARVYCEEERMPESARSAQPVGGDEIDLLAYAGDEPVGALRLRVVTPASGREPLAALSLASKFRFHGFEAPDVVLGEITGFCIVRRFRGTRVAALLFGALRVESARKRVTHWVAAANTETDSAEDAEIAYRLLLANRLVSTRFRALPRDAEPPPSATRFLYTPDERRRAAGGELQALKLPRVLALFAGKMGARYIGPPVYDRDFNVFATPLAVELAALPVIAELTGTAA